MWIMYQQRSQQWWFGLSCRHSYWDWTFAVGGKTPAGPDDEDDCARVGVLVKSSKTSVDHCACYGLPLTFIYGASHQQWFTISCSHPLSGDRYQNASLIEASTWKKYTCAFLWYPCIISKHCQRQKGSRLLLLWLVITFLKRAGKDQWINLIGL